MYKRQEEREGGAVKLAGEGMLGKAAGVFKGVLPAMVSDESTDDLRRKHPEARVTESARCDNLRPIAGAAAPSLTVDEVLKAIKGFPQGSAGGKSGLKPQHLKDALVPGYGDEMVRTITDVATLLASGKAHPSAREWICCASLTALSKLDGSLPPIAIGATLRRLVGKVLAKDASDDFLSYVEPSQVGVGSKGGAEAVVHTVRQYAARNRAVTAALPRSTSVTHLTALIGRRLGPKFGGSRHASRRGWTSSMGRPPLSSSAAPGCRARGESGRGARWAQPSSPRPCTRSLRIKSP